MRVLLFLVISAAMLLAGCRTPEQPSPDPPNDGGGDGLETVAPSGGGETLGQRIERLTG